MLIKFVFLLYSLLTFSILADSVILNNRDNFKNITPKTKILKKSERNIDIIRKPEVEINFKKINSTSLNLGIIQGEFWLKYEIKNNSNNPDWIFEFDHPHIEKIEFYEFNKNNLINNLSTGNKFPLSSKIIPSKNFLFPVIIPKGKERTYYIFIKARTSLIINLYIWQKNKYITQVSKENFLYGIYLGIMMVMALYNLFLFLSIKESTYLYYILYILCFTTMQEAKNGFMYVTFLQDFPFLSNNIVPLFIPLAVIFSVLFTKNFLRTKSNSKRSNFFLNLLIILTIIVAALSFLLPPHLALISALFTAGYWSFTMFGVSLASLINGFRPARIFFLAWSFLIASVFISALNVSGVLEDNFFTLHCMEIGSSIEVILLSLALADRINILKKEKESAQKEILNKQISLSKSFARFVPFEMLEILNKKIITDVELGDAVEKEMTVLFTDIRNYTTISEKFSPEENFKFLNIVLKDLGPIIRSNNGVIDKFIGDAIMALFPGSPSDAIKSAIQITQQIKHINKNLISLNYPSIDIGIGINTGKLILGTVGEKERMEATVISDTVNLASRIEGLTKYYNSKILIGEDTIKSLDENNNFLLRKIDKVKVKGKNNPINLYEILDNDEKSGKIYSSYLKNFEDTIQLFREKKFKKAKMNFQKFLKINPEDKLLSIYLSRCEDYIKKPPLKNWDGTNEMNFK